MRLISISEYDHESMVLAMPVYDSKQRILLSAGQRIHPKLLERLQQFGILSLFVEDSDSQGIRMEEMFDMPTWMDMMQVVEKSYAAAKTGKSFPIKEVQNGVRNLIFEVKRRPIQIPIPTLTLAEETRRFAHPVNVALTALQTAKRLGYNDQQYMELGIGCLLHDIGKELVNDVKEHPLAGFTYLKKIHEISLLSAHIALQHHEEFEGSGYPRAVQGKDFIEYAQICGVANRFDNMTSGQLSPHDALEYVMSVSDIKYSHKVTEAFVNSVPAYTPGTKVRLHNGERSIVVRIASHMQRPVIRMLDSGAELSLAEHPSITIAGTC